jgi:hypothetical protein
MLNQESVITIVVSEMPMTHLIRFAAFLCISVCIFASSACIFASAARSSAKQIFMLASRFVKRVYKRDSDADIFASIAARCASNSSRLGPFIDSAPVTDMGLPDSDDARATVCRLCRSATVFWLA